ncbi:MAG: adenylyltransferase/cytidyltransferase family protein [Fibromonadales bacterium]|nr:adenylyltransferase/cytidyltransferase family protein [Fibromonadales bacterium]
MADVKKYKIGFTDGVFDLFHIGHLNMINQAKLHCDYLIVGVHGDDVVFEYKNKRPVICEEERRTIVESIKGVDKAVINRTRDKLELWDLYRFNAMIIGDDWKGTERWNNFEKILAEKNVDVVYIPYTQGISTTDIKKKILEI